MQVLGQNREKPIKLWKDGFAEKTLRRLPQQTDRGATSDYEDLRATGGSCLAPHRNACHSCAHRLRSSSNVQLTSRRPQVRGLAGRRDSGARLRGELLVAGRRALPGRRLTLDLDVRVI